MPQPRPNDPLRRAIRKLVRGLGRREQVRRARRRYKRHPLDIKVHLCVHQSNDRYHTLCDAWAQDLSLGGISCLAEKPIDVNNTVYVNLQAVLGYDCYIPVRIRHCYALTDNIHMIRGQFVYDINNNPAEEPTATDDAEGAEAA